MQQRTRPFNFFALILVIILIILFYRELFITGVRVYAAVADNPEADTLLGDYYRTAAKQNENYSNLFYKKALSKYEIQLTTASDSQKAKLYIKVGRFYECAKGTKQNLDTAKTHYQEAQKAAGAAPDKAATTSEVLDANKRIADAMKPNAPPLVCTDEFNFMQIFMPSGSATSGTGSSDTSKTK